MIALPDHVEIEVQQILNRAARRILAEKVCLVQRLYDEGQPWEAITRAAGWSRQVCQQIALQPRLKGGTLE